MRVTADLDEPTKYEITRTWQRMARIGTEVSGRLSSSGSGVHIKCWGVDTDDPRAEAIRRQIGDDPKRIAFDVIKPWRASQVLYDEKLGKTAGEWTESLEYLIGEYGRRNPEVIQ